MKPTPHGLSSRGLRRRALAATLVALLAPAAPAARAQSVPIIGDICVSTTVTSQIYKYWQENSGWMGVAAGALNETHSAYIAAVTSDLPNNQLLYASEIANETNLLVRRHTGAGLWQYARVYATLPYNAGHLADLDAGSGDFPLDTKVTRIYSGVSGDCGLLRVWNLAMTAGRTYRFEFCTSRPGDDVRLDLLLSGGQNGWLSRADALLEHAAADTSDNIPTFDYAATTTGSYALAVFNNTIDSQGGRYTLRILEVVPPAEPDLVVARIEPGAATAGQSVTAMVAVRNQGAGAAPASHARLLRDGVTICDAIATPALAAGAETQVTCPLGALPAGSYSLQACADTGLEVNEGANEGNNCAYRQLVVSEAPLPDLVVESIAPDQAAVGQVVQASIVVRNQGGAAAAASHTTMVVDGSAWYMSSTTPPLAPGAAWTIRVDIGPFTTIGTHVLEACADANDAVEESSESNCLSRSLAIRGPDLYVVRIDPDSARTGSPTTVSIQIRNQGLASASASVTSLTVDGVVMAARIPTPQISAGQSETVTWSLGSLRWKTYQLRAVADAGLGVTESDEGNNARTESLVVSPPSRVLVRPDGSGDFVTIQAAIDSVLPWTTIELPGGVYTGPGNRDLDFRGKALTVMHEPLNEVAPAVIDCQASYSNQHRGFDFHTNETSHSVVRGITIRNAYSTGGGGGIRCYEASPTIEACSIVDNLTEPANGGGIYCYNSSARIVDCLIADNIAAGGQEDPIDTYGGGLYCGGATGNASTVTVLRATFAGNRATYGAAIGLGNGGADVDNAIMSLNYSYGSPVEVRPGLEGHAYLACTDVYGNSGGDWVYYIAPQRTLNGNTWVDPLFCDPAVGNFTLHSDSPCYGPNSPTCGQIGWPGAACGPTSAHEWVVRPDGTGDHATIQAAIDASLNGDSVLLGDGTFTGAGNRDLDYHGKKITLRSQSGNADACVIDCQGSSGTPRRGFYFHTGEDSTCILREVTVRNGWTTSNGGAVSCLSAAPKIVGCVFENNRAGDGGGLMAQLGSPVVENCIFRNNTATDAGGGMMAHTCSPQIRACLFTGNTAIYGGGAVYDYQSSTRLRDCTFTGNSSSSGGGGAVHSAENLSRTVVRGGTFSGNSAVNGGGLCVRNGSIATVESCTFQGNSATSRGGGVAAYNSAGVSAGHTILWGNTSPTGAQVAVYVSSSGTFGCDDLQGGQAAIYKDASSTVVWNAGNLDVDPLFCAPAGGDLALQGASPCAPANSPACGQIGSRSVGCAQDLVVDPGRIGGYATIQQAIDASSDGDVILLADGIYYGLGNRDLDFGGRRITLRSQSGDPSACLIICQGSEGNPHRGFHFHSGEDSLSVVIGVTITGGWVSGYGGGILVAGASPKIENCIISGNHASSTGGGMHAYQGSPVLRRTVFRDNSAGDAAGGLSTHSGAAIVQACLFEHNSAAYAGGGMFNYSASPAVTGCVFTDNSASTMGGAVQNRTAGAAPVIAGCTFRGNRAFMGGTIYNDQGAAPTIAGCTLTGNRGMTGGGLYNTGPGTSAAIDHTIIAFGTEGAAVYSASGATATLSCCDLYGNVGGDWVAGAAGQAGINGNLSADPIFCNAATGELTLYPASPCAAANNPGCGRIGAWPETGCAVTGVGEPPASTVRAVALHPPVPNPFNPRTTISFDLPGAGRVRLTVHDLSGRCVADLASGEWPGGAHAVVWDGRDRAGRPAASGLYFVRLKTAEGAWSRRLVLVR